MFQLNLRLSFCVYLGRSQRKGAHSVDLSHVHSVDLSHVHSVDFSHAHSVDLSHVQSYLFIERNLERAVYLDTKIPKEILTNLKGTRMVKDGEN